jgi:hypothetical protein
MLNISRPIRGRSSFTQATVSKRSAGETEYGVRDLSPLLFYLARNAGSRKRVAVTFRYIGGTGDPLCFLCAWERVLSALC